PLPGHHPDQRADPGLRAQDRGSPGRGPVLRPVDDVDAGQLRLANAGDAARGHSLRGRQGGGFTVDLAAVILERMPTVGLVLMRISGIIAVAPPFAAAAVPATLRGLLALVLTLIVVPAAPVWEGAGPWEFAAAAAGELMVGLAVGLLILLVLLAVQGAGELIDMEMGFGMVNVIDPAFGRPAPLLGNFLYFLALVIFLTVDGHLLVLRALLDSFQAIPPGGGRWEAPLFAAIVQQFSWVFVTAVRIALPVVGVVFLA